jgi:hypothetical protein
MGSTCIARTAKMTLAVSPAIDSTCAGIEPGGALRRQPSGDGGNRGQQDEGVDEGGRIAHHDSARR